MPSRPGALAAADFDYNYTPVNDQYPAIAPGNYIVSAGDTLRGIALAVYGDAQLWYLIADANGLQTDAELTVGSSLTIPNKVTNLRNAYDTYKPYEPGKIIGDLTPTLPEPPPPDDDGDDCGGIGFVIVAIVAVVVAMYTAGASLAAMAPEATVITSTQCTVAGSLAASEGFMSLGSAVLAGGAEGAAGIGAAMIGGAAGSVASQAVGIALGIQDEFSWGNVALAAIGAGVSAGLASPGSPLAGTTGGMPIVRAMVGSAISQGIGVAVGLQDKFNWKGVAAAGVGAGVSLGLGQNLPRAATPFGGLLRETAIGFASGVAKQAVYGGRINFANIAADAFGNALGSSLAYSAMAVGSTAQQEQTLDDALADAFQTSSIDRSKGVQVADAGLTMSDGIYSADDFDEEEIPGGGVGSDIPGSQSGSRALASRYSLRITADRNLPGRERVELISDTPSDRIRALEEGMLEQQRAEFAQRMDEAAKAEAAQAATDQNSYPIDPTDGMRAGPTIERAARLHAAMSPGAAVPAPFSAVPGSPQASASDLALQIENYASNAGYVFLAGEKLTEGMARLQGQKILQRAAPLLTWSHQWKVGGAFELKEAIDVFKGPNGQTVQALRNAATTYGPALRSFGYLGIAANVVEEAAFIVHTGEDKFGRAWASSAHNIMGDVGATAAGMKMGAAIGTGVGILFPPVAPIAIPVGAAVGGLLGHWGWDEGIKPRLREFYLSIPVPDKK